jgi:hypothetical protein
LDRKQAGDYVCSLPERVLRSLSALSAGVARELSEVVLPARVRKSKLYESMVESTLRFLIEQVGQVEGAYTDGSALPPDFLVRRSAGNIFEIAGVAAFHASPVWVLSALADVAGAGRELIGEISVALQEEGLLEPGVRFTSVDQLLDGFERTAGRLAETVNTPPMDVPALRAEWQKIRQDASRIPAAGLPAIESLIRQWRDLKAEAAVQDRSVLELSSLMAVGAVRALPDQARWLSRSFRTGGRRTGEVLAGGLLDHYQKTLAEIREAGYLRYWLREYQPYLKGALQQFSVNRPTLTERLLRRRRSRIL